MPPPEKLRLDSRAGVHITAQPLTPAAFAPFGEVVQNPAPGVHPSQYANSDTQGPLRLPFDAVSANQGSAIKYQHVTRMANLYAGAPSGRPAAAVVNMFVCAARRLLSSSFPPPSSSPEQTPPPPQKDGAIFPVTILERHPYTSQTFIPLSTSGSLPAPIPAEETRYLVIVAPSLPPSPADAHLPVPSLSSSPSIASAASAAAAAPNTPAGPLPGRGLPDLRRLRAFVATGAQAVTYGPGTWHAPMAALGRLDGDGDGAIDFVVVQFANGVPVEDCQEVEIELCGPEETAAAAVTVRVPRVLRAVKAKL